MHQANLLIQAGDRPNLLVEIMNLLSTLKITVLALNAISHNKNLNASIELSLMVKDGEHLKSIINSLKNIKSIYEIERVEHL